MIISLRLFNQNFLNESYKNILSKKIKVKFTNSLSKIEYGDKVYGPRTTQIEGQRLEKVQNCYVRYILSLRRTESTLNHIRALTWFTMNQCWTIHLIYLVHFVLHKKEPMRF